MENKYIYLSPPDIDENEKAMPLDALNSNWIALLVHAWIYLKMKLPNI